MMTPVALMTGSQRRPERVAEPRRGDGFDPRDDRGFGVASATSPRGDGARARRPRAARSASTVASAPNRASSARTAGRCRSCSIDGIDAEVRHCRIADHGIAAESCSNPAILQYYVIDPMTSDPPEIPAARALLAVRRSARAADRRGARGARSRSARGAVRRAAAAVLDHAGVSARSTCPTSRARSSSRARRPSSARPAAGAALPLSRAVLVERRRRGCATCSRSSARSDATEVLIDDRPVPYARELWLPLVWFLIPR